MRIVKELFFKKFLDERGARIVKKSRRPERERRGFEDIKSDSTGGQSRPEWFSETKRQRSQQRERSAARSVSNSRSPNRRPRNSSQRKGSRPSQSTRPGTRPASRPNRRDEPRKRKKPMSLFKRRLLIVLALLGMVFVTVFLAESLLLRVTEVKVTGDQIYAEEDIKKLCGFKEGDNLLLIPASDREEKLESQLPYISKAKITRKIPGTVVIEITASRGVCSMESGGAWWVIDGTGKVLETCPGPKEGLMQVLGVTAQSARTGEKLVLEGEESSAVFTEIIGIIDRLGEDGGSAASEFTKMDLTNLYDIRLWYEDRVECVLGNKDQLDYKLIQGYGILTNLNDKGIKEGQRGVLDLSYLPTKKASYFREDEGSEGAQGTVPPAQPTAAPDGTVPEPEPTAEPGRGDEIPDGPFTG